MIIKKKNLMTAILIAISLLYGWMADNTAEGKQRFESNSAFIEKIIDGDTVEANVRGRIERIRFIGIDAPELSQKPWGKLSKKYLEGLISASGWQVRIEYDVEKRDKHGRLLAYLWSRGNRLINEEMLIRGYAVLYTLPPNVKYVDRLTSAQVIARANKHGIWGRGGLKELPSDFRKEHPRK